MHLGIKLAPTQKVTAKLTDKYFFNKFISQIYFLKNKHFLLFQFLICRWISSLRPWMFLIMKQLLTAFTVESCYYLVDVKLPHAIFLSQNIYPSKWRTNFEIYRPDSKSIRIWRVIAYYFIPWMHCFAPLEHWPCFVYTLSNKIINYMKLGY